SRGRRLLHVSQDMSGATVDYYVVRIYRKPPTDDGRGALVGLVETRSGEQRKFQTMEELWHFLKKPVK
ncbi:MAG TPA: hypothetical protein VFZ81_09475, partial [Burkholderiales bacterium]